ncbi:hypothetical protein COP1_024207 [Malus domestica]
MIKIISSKGHFDSIVNFPALFMRRLRGSWRDSNLEAKLLTEARELRSRAMTMILESGNSEGIRALASLAALRLQAGRTSLAPRLAKTRVVSTPIPDVAPMMMAVMWRRSGEASVTCSADIRALVQKLTFANMGQYTSLHMCPS